MQNDKDLQRPEHSLTFRLDFEIRIFLLNIRVFLLPKAFAIWLFFWFPPDISNRNQQNPGVVAVANPLPLSVFGKSWDSGFTRWDGYGDDSIRSDLRFGWRWFFLGHEWAWNIFDFFCLTLSWLEEVQLEDGSYTCHTCCCNIMFFSCQKTIPYFSEACI